MSQLQIRPSQSSSHASPSEPFLADIGSRSFAALAKESASAIAPHELPTAALSRYVTAQQEMLAKNASGPANERLLAHKFEVGGRSFFAINQHTQHPAWGRESSHAEIFDATGRRVAEVQQSGHAGAVDEGGTTARLRNDPSFATHQGADRGALEAQLHLQSLEKYRQQLEIMPAVSVFETTSCDGKKCTPPPPPPPAYPPPPAGSDRAQAVAWNLKVRLADGIFTPAELDDVLTGFTQLTRDERAEAKGLVQAQLNPPPLPALAENIRYVLGRFDEIDVTTPAFPGTTAALAVVGVARSVAGDGVLTPADVSSVEDKFQWLTPSDRAATIGGIQTLVKPDSQPNVKAAVAELAKDLADFDVAHPGFVDAVVGEVKGFAGDGKLTAAELAELKTHYSALSSEDRAKVVAGANALLGPATTPGAAAVIQSIIKAFAAIEAQQAASPAAAAVLALVRGSASDGVLSPNELTSIEDGYLALSSSDRATVNAALAAFVTPDTAATVSNAVLDIQTIFHAIDRASQPSS